MSAGFRKLLVEGKEYPSEFCASIKGTMYNVHDFSAKKGKERRHKIPKLQACRAIISLKL